jgi:hypothetical protein
MNPGLRGGKPCDWSQRRSTVEDKERERERGGERERTAQKG